MAKRYAPGAIVVGAVNEHWSTVTPLLTEVVTGLAVQLIADSPGAPQESPPFEFWSRIANSMVVAASPVPPHCPLIKPLPSVVAWNELQDGLPPPPPPIRMCPSMPSAQTMLAENRTRVNNDAILASLTCAPPEYSSPYPEHAECRISISPRRITPAFCTRQNSHSS